MLEDNLLSRLSSASGNFLGDTELVENLETTKCTAAEIQEKVALLLTVPLLSTYSRMLIEVTLVR